MLCDQCRERDSAITVTTTDAQGEVREEHLCDRCAAARNIETTLTGGAKHPLSAFLQDVQQRSIGDAATGGCPFCGMTLPEFRASNRWGCARCYHHFEPGIRELLRRVHGSSRHVGQTYRQPQGELVERANTIGELRERLRRAVEGEQFEQAAELRDRIRGME